MNYTQNACEFNATVVYLVESACRCFFISPATSHSHYTRLYIIVPMLLELFILIPFANCNALIFFPVVYPLCPPPLLKSLAVSPELMHVPSSSNY